MHYETFKLQNKRLTKHGIFSLLTVNMTKHGVYLGLVETIYGKVMGYFGVVEGRRKTTLFLSHLYRAKLKHKVKGATFPGMVEERKVNFLKTKILYIILSNTLHI